MAIFPFARHGAGTHFEAFMVLGVAIYLIFNNTHDSMDNIAKDPRWIQAQVPFAEIGDKLRATRWSSPRTRSSSRNNFLLAGLQPSRPL